MGYEQLGRAHLNPNAAIRDGFQTQRRFVSQGMAGRSGWIQTIPPEARDPCGANDCSGWAASNRGRRHESWGPSPPHPIRCQA